MSLGSRQQQQQQWTHAWATRQPKQRQEKRRPRCKQCDNDVFTLPGCKRLHHTWFQTLKTKPTDHHWQSIRNNTLWLCHKNWSQARRHEVKVSPLTQWEASSWQWPIRSVHLYVTNIWGNEASLTIQWCTVTNLSSAKFYFPSHNTSDNCSWWENYVSCDHSTFHLLRLLLWAMHAHCDTCRIVS